MVSTATWAGVAAGGFVVVIIVIIIFYRLCCAKKRGSKRLNSSLRKEEKERRISSLSITHTVSEEPKGLYPRVLTLHTAPVSETDKTRGIIQRYSEPIMSRSSFEDVTEQNRPQSDTSSRHEAFRNLGKAINQSHSDGEIKIPYTMQSSLSSINKDRSYRTITESKDSGVGDDVPVWSMESTEYHSSSTSNLFENTAL